MVEGIRVKTKVWLVQGRNSGYTGHVEYGATREEEKKKTTEEDMQRINVTDRDAKVKGWDRDEEEEKKKKVMMMPQKGQ